jgi:galactokinase
VTAPKTTEPLSQLTEKFVSMFGVQPIVVQAPGRVNLIGEHTDYNDGFVMPAAIQFHTTVAIAARNDARLVINSENYAEQVEFALSDLPNAARRHWSDYVIGVARELRERGVHASGASLLIHGDVPEGAGLSSSASLEVAVCRAFLEVADATMTGAEIAQLSQRAENEFVGARCGIMDQFVSVHGRRDQALLLDCRTLEYSHEPLPENVRLVICNTMVRHSVSGGEYNLRREQCETGARFFAERIPGVKALRDVSIEQFQNYAGELPEKIRKRCRHVITEDARVTLAAGALARHDLHKFGELVGESHVSLRDDFEVSCRELDVMVELAAKVEGVYGSRMTGGGFGGCTINLVKNSAVEEFRSVVAPSYERATGKSPEIYVCLAADGVSRVR